MSAPSEAGGENLARLKSALRREPRAISALREMGLAPGTIERLHLGLKAPYRARSDELETRDAVCFPLLGEGMRAVGRYAYLNLPDVTTNPLSPTTWGPGPPNVYRLGSFAPDATVLVMADVVGCWLMWQVAGGERPDLAFVSRSHASGWPAEWRGPAFWTGFTRVLVLPGPGSADFLEEVGPKTARSIERIRLPAPSSDIPSYAADPLRAGLDDVLAQAEPWTVPPPKSAAAIPDGSLGRFQAAPVRIVGAFADGYCYYPFAVETRTAESGSGTAWRVVQSYSTMVLRSDGSLLTTEMLPAPRGTPSDQRVLALSDGTRIQAEPVACRDGTWSFGSIERFVDWKTKGGPPPFRPLCSLLEDVEAFLASRIWLPDRGGHLLASIYVALSFVFRVFDAIPLLLIRGPRGTGKSELGEAIARVSFNATIAGQLRAAGMIRLLDETRGLLVLDDMDGDGAASVIGTGELAQVMKTSYKKSTSRKPVADRGGRVRIIDFFGPKVIGNTRGVDQVLGSRMLQISTDARPGCYGTDDRRWEEPRLSDLRDELHCWGMASAADLHAVFRSLPDTRMDRRSEITAPIKAIAAIASNAEILARIDRVFADPATFPGVG